MTNFQKLSIKSMVIYLKNFLTNDFLKEYQEIRLLFQEILVILFDRVDFIDASAPEICVYCNEFVENEKLMCPDNHNMARCCISMVQVINIKIIYITVFALIIITECSFLLPNFTRDRLDYIRLTGVGWFSLCTT